MLCTNIFSQSGLYCHSSVICRAKVFNFDTFQLIFFLYLRTLYLTQGLEDLLICFFLEVLKFCSTFRFLIYFELITVQGVRYRLRITFFFCIWLLIVPAAFDENTVFSLLNCCCTFCQKSIYHICVDLVCFLCVTFPLSLFVFLSLIFFFISCSFSYFSFSLPSPSFPFLYSSKLSTQIRIT